MKGSRWLGVTGLLVLAGVGAVPSPARALTAPELRGLLERREAVTVVDVRSAGEFERGHVPGAIHIPAGVVTHKRLPPLGRVVVCGDGVRGDEARRALESLNAKPGIRAELLEGGYPAWEGDGAPSTRLSGLEEERLRYLTYQELEAVAADALDLVLVDLRGGGEGPSTDLSVKFPGAALRRPGAEAGGEASVAAEGHPARKLLVLIDDGDGAAEAVARRLMAAGARRVAILAGGEVSLRREGRPGLRTVESGAPR